MTVAQRAEAALDRFRARRAFSRLGLAVSGGGDSVALMRLAADWARRRDVALAAATVDHGLRPEAAEEAASVRRAAADLTIGHATLVWRWDGQGNIQDAARRGRRDLLAEWAAGVGLEAVALGHTRDDQAETVLMRLIRGSGVDGLSAMAEERTDRTRWLRPLLTIGRSELRQWLEARGASWVDDPSNDDERFLRIRVRRALHDLGLDDAGLVDTAARMSVARDALERLALMTAREAVRVDHGDVLIRGLEEWPEETRQRIFAHAIRWIGGTDYRPRLAALREAMREGAVAPRPLAGVMISPGAPGWRLTREPAAVAALTAPPGSLWDDRWRIVGPCGPGDEVRSLGASGLAHCPDWRASGLPRMSLLASPAVWNKDRLVAAPLAGRGEGWSAALAPGRDEFTAGLLTR